MQNTNTPWKIATNLARRSVEMNDGTLRGTDHLAFEERLGLAPTAEEYLEFEAGWAAAVAAYRENPGLDAAPSALLVFRRHHPEQAIDAAVAKELHDTWCGLMDWPPSLDAWLAELQRLDAAA